MVEKLNPCSQHRDTACCVAEAEAAFTHSCWVQRRHTHLPDTRRCPHPYPALLCSSTAEQRRPTSFFPHQFVLPSDIIPRVSWKDSRVEAVFTGGRKSPLCHCATCASRLTVAGWWLVCPSVTIHPGLGRGFARLREIVLLPAGDVTHILLLQSVPSVNASRGDTRF